MEMVHGRAGIATQQPVRLLVSAAAAAVHIVAVVVDRRLVLGLDF